jgi:F0F1-type ATP synthase gamma subunit
MRTEITDKIMDKYPEMNFREFYIWKEKFIPGTLRKISEKKILETKVKFRKNEKLQKSTNK